jgi:hypothetical protein
MSSPPRRFVIRSLRHLRHPRAGGDRLAAGNVEYLNVVYTGRPSGFGLGGMDWDDLLAELGIPPRGKLIQLAEARGRRERGEGPPRRPRKRRTR